VSYVEEILYQETSCVDPDDVPLLMEVIDDKIEPRNLDTAIGECNRITLNGLIDMVKEVALFCVEVGERLQTLDEALKESEGP
jgi:hypothetical protein